MSTCLRCFHLDELHCKFLDVDPPQYDSCQLLNCMCMGFLGREEFLEERIVCLEMRVAALELKLLGEVKA